MPIRRRSTGGPSCRACSATSAAATRRWSCSVAGSPHPCSSRRSARSSSCTRRPTSPWRGRRPISACRCLLQPGVGAHGGVAAAMGDRRVVPALLVDLRRLVESLVARAEACGCDALVVTLDTTCSAGGRATSTWVTCPSRGARASRSTPPTRRSGGWWTRARRRPGVEGPAPRPRWPPPALVASPAPARAPARQSAARRCPARPSRRSWASTRGPRSAGRPRWLRARTRLPIVLKGVLHPDDARRALDEGVDGVVGARTAGGRWTARSQPRRAAGRRRRRRRPRAGSAGQRGAQRRRRPRRRRARRPGGAARPPLRLGTGLAGEDGVARWCPTSSGSST